MSVLRVFPNELSPYWLEATFEIRQVLKTLAKRTEKITVYPAMGDAFVTLLLDVTERGDVVLDAHPHAVVDAAALGDQTVRVHGEVDRIDIDFSLAQGKSVNYEGSPALLFPAPTRLHKLQRREFFRLPTSMAKPLMCSLWGTDERLPDKLVEHLAQVLDISLGGVCIQHPPTLTVKQGDVFKGCAMSLPDGGVKFDLAVRHTFDVENRLGRTSHRAGCEFVNLSPASQQSVQRFMSKLERDRRSTMV